MIDVSEANMTFYSTVIINQELQEGELVTSNERRDAIVQPFAYVQ